MPKKLIALWMACFFLAGSTILPLGDFSLLRDIPRMYHNYKKITTLEELSLFDFVGDYLLQGKEIFGHNKHDKSENPVTNTQFRHQANSPHVLLATFFFSEIKAAPNKNTYNARKMSFVIAGYTNKLLRPPLS